MIESGYYMTKYGERSKMTVYFRSKEQETIFKIRDDDKACEDPRLLQSLRYHHIKGTSKYSVCYERREDFLSV